MRFLLTRVRWVCRRPLPAYPRHSIRSSWVGLTGAYERARRLVTGTSPCATPGPSPCTKKGAKLAGIGRGLDHSNLKITSDYVEEQLGYVNAHARDLEDEFGI